MALDLDGLSAEVVTPNGMYHVGEKNTGVYIVLNWVIAKNAKHTNDKTCVRGGMHESWTWDDDLPHDLPDWARRQQHVMPTPTMVESAVCRQESLPSQHCVDLPSSTLHAAPPGLLPNSSSSASSSILAENAHVRVRADNDKVEYKKEIIMGVAVPTHMQDYPAEEEVDEEKDMPGTDGVKHVSLEPSLYV